MPHNVGKILYLLSNKNLKIVAARVEAVTTVETISGSKTTHQVSVLGYDDNVVLETLKVNVFTTIQLLKEHLLKVINDKVSSEVSSVVEQATIKWPVLNEHVEENKVLPHKISVDEAVENSVDDTIHVELADGMRARVHIPKELL
ncbi:MAG: hypothetical protein H8E12_10520 [Rhodobacteraceae bacterium]|nr:hypothetical protein [Paracoccaceae bacterium]